MRTQRPRSNQLVGGGELGKETLSRSQPRPMPPLSANPALPLLLSLSLHLQAALVLVLLQRLLVLVLVLVLALALDELLLDTAFAAGHLPLMVLVIKEHAVDVIQRRSDEIRPFLLPLRADGRQHRLAQVLNAALGGEGREEAQLLQLSDVLVELLFSLVQVLPGLGAVQSLLLFLLGEPFVAVQVKAELLVLLVPAVCA